MHLVHDKKSDTSPCCSIALQSDPDASHCLLLGGTQQHCRCSLVDSAGQPCDPLRHQEDVVTHQPTQWHRVNGAIQLRQAVQHHRLQAGDGGQTQTSNQGKPSNTRRITCSSNAHTSMHATAHTEHIV